MEHTTYASRLRYLDADDVDDSAIDFDGLDVHGTDGEKLGDLDGFLVEPGAGQVLYLVVDSGGWFTSRRFLLPVEHARLDRDGKSLRVNVSRQSLRGYPEFDEDRFASFSDDEYHAYHRRLATVWTPAAPVTVAATTYRQPEWWPSKAYGADRLRPIESRSFTSRTSTSGAVAAANVPHRHGDRTHSHPGGHEQHSHDQVLAHGGDERHPDHDAVHEAGRRDADDVSPHFGGRAQPGDILGIETGGETTSIGDSAEDENKRRRQVDKSPPRD